MSARSIGRARERQSRSEHRRDFRRAKRVGAGAGGLLAAALVVAPGANAANFTVTNTDDSEDTCTAIDCSLREAVNAANANGVDDTITFAPGVVGTINLAPAFDDIQIRNEGLQIQGPGAGQLTISGGDHDRIFKLFGFEAADEQVVISGLTLSDGSATDGGAIVSLDGAPIDNETFDFGFPADLTVADSVISDSIAQNGGAIATRVIDSSSTGGLTIRNSTIDGNEAEIGGGIHATRVGQEIEITASTLSNNSALAPEVSSRAAGFISTGDGGAVAIEDGPGIVLIQNSTVSSNHADGAGGGIRLLIDPGDPRTIRNSTIAGNSAAEGGGVSISRRQEEQVDDAPGGIVVETVVDLSSTIVSDNTADAVAGASDGPDLRTDNASIEAGFSLFEDTTGATITNAPAGSNITGQDPQLGPLAGNGGPTNTRLPATTSAAVDAGVANGLATDQRGLARTVDRPAANASGGDATDIGSVELPAPSVEGDPLPGPPLLTRCLGEVLRVKRGSPEGERIEGTPERDGVFARGGADDIFGLEDRDCLFGGPGRDEMDGGPGADSVQGDPDDDVVQGNGGDDDVRGQNGDDSVFGGPGGDKRVTGGAGDDRIFGGDGDDSLIKGNGGDDYLNLGTGRDRALAGGGADYIQAFDHAPDRIDCGTGKDTAIVDAMDHTEGCNFLQIKD